MINKILWFGAVLMAWPISALELNGEGIVSEYNTELYAAGLYLSAPSDSADEVRSSQNDKTMRVVVLKDEWGERRWARYWRDRIATNNPSGDFDDGLTESIIQFTQFLQAPLEKGDEVTIEYRRENSSTQITLNNSVIITNAGSSLFDVIANTWIGDVPPSREFKKSVLSAGMVGEDGAAAVLANNTIPDARLGLVERWRNRALEQAQAREQARAANDAKLEAEEAAEEPIAAAVDEPSTDVNNDVPVRIAPKASTEDEISRPPVPADNPSAQPTVASNTATPIGDVQPPDQVTLTRQDERSQLSGDWLQRFVDWQLQRYVNAHTRYPHWGKKFGYEGVAKVSVVYDGQSLSTSVASDNSVHPSLVEALVDTIAEASDHIYLPPTEKIGSVTTALSYTFSLKNIASDSLSGLVPPPLDGALSEEELAIFRKGEPEYRRYAEAYLTSNIELSPQYTALGNTRGTIKLRVSLDRWGNITDVVPAGKNRPKSLEQAYIQVIEQVEFLKPLPIGMTDLSIDIERRFR